MKQRGPSPHMKPQVASPHMEEPTRPRPWKGKAVISSHIPVCIVSPGCLCFHSYMYVHCIAQNDSGEAAAAAGKSGRALSAIKLGLADAANPPLLAGKGDQLQVLGFYSLARCALLEPLMRFGIPVEGGLAGLHTLFLQVGQTCGPTHMRACTLPPGWTCPPCICVPLQEQAVALLSLPVFLTGMQALLVTCS